MKLTSFKKDMTKEKLLYYHYLLIYQTLKIVSHCYPVRMLPGISNLAVLAFTPATMYPANLVPSQKY